VGTRLEQILASASAVKPFPRVAQQALALLDDPMVSSAKLSSVVSLDAGVTAAVLKAANSAAYARSRQVDDLKQALALLGNAKFRELIFASASAPFLAASQPGYHLAPGSLWRHSVATSVLAEQLASQAKLELRSGLLFTAGLLHDLGKSVLSQFVEREAAEITRLVQAGQTFLEAERQVLGVHHAELGAQVAERWNFSRELVELIRFHHEPHLRPESKPLAALHVAAVVSELTTVTGSADAFSQKADERAVKLLGLHRTDLEAAVAEAHVRLTQAEALLAMAPVRS
jgi:putative nucleotidyltransferase with HDIG domain